MRSAVALSQAHSQILQHAKRNVVNGPGDKAAIYNIMVLEFCSLNKAMTSLLHQ